MSGKKISSLTFFWQSDENPNLFLVKWENCKKSTKFLLKSREIW